MSVTRWYHFSFFVISTALLGFGISGILLLFAGPRLLKNYGASCFWLCLSTAVLGNLALRVSQSLPLDSQYLLHSTDQLGLFAMINGLVLIPFLLGATVIALALMKHREKAGTLYGISMVGSAAGSVCTIALMFFVGEERLLQIAFLPALVGAGIWLTEGRHLMRATGFAVAILIASVTLYHPDGLVIEPYKTLALLQRWTEQGDASLVLTRHSPRGRIDVFQSRLLHYTLFAGLNARQAPPPQLAILRDGSFAGAIFKIQSAEDAAILDQVPSSLAYRLESSPSVLLLEEAGGTNVWMARRFGAQRITIVQSDPEVVAILRGPLADMSGHVFSGPNENVIVGDPRLYLETPGEKFDVIHEVPTEEMVAESGGVGGLYEDYLLTVEGLIAAWRRLSPRGVLVMTRGIQVPPRDSLKLLAIMTSALKKEGVPDPQNHIVLAENYLADCIMLFRSPLTINQTASIESLSDSLALSLLWPQINQQGRPGTTVSQDDTQFPTVGEASREILAGDRNRLIEDWVYDIRPSTDVRPFFRDFFRVRAIGWMKTVYGDQWFQRVELGFAILLVVFATLSVLALLLILVPVILWSRRLRKNPEPSSHPPLVPTLAFFSLIGLGFMSFEITAISRLTLYLGDPVYSATLAITAMLVGAGAGSIRAGAETAGVLRKCRTAAACTIALGSLLLLSTFAFPSTMASMSFPLRATVCCLALLPLSFFMGFLFPCGLLMARTRSETLVPWAWAANGFSSVIAPPLITMIAMSFGQRLVLLVALLCYGFAALLAGPLGNHGDTEAPR